MLENLFTTKMSADKKKLQHRFSKIRSTSSSFSKIIAIVMLGILILSVICISIYFAMDNFLNRASENPDINALYELKSTFIGDAPTVRKIVDMTNIGNYNVDSIELKTDIQPFCLIVNFKVDSRENYRFIDENELNKMSGLIFSLIQNADEILYRFYDDFSANTDDIFFAAYYNKVNLCERISNNIIIPDNITSSTDNIKTFEKYYETLISTEVAMENNEFLKYVYDYIGNDYEIVVNSGIGADVMIDELPESEVAKLENLLGNKTIGKYYGTGILTHLITYDIRNFKTDEYKKCAFLYHIHPDQGLVVVGEKFITESEFGKIQRFITSLNN